MNKTYFLVFILLISTRIFSQESNIIPGNIIVMLHNNSEADELVSNLKTVGGIKTSFRLERILSEGMHILLFDFDVNTMDANKMLKAVKTNPLVLIAQFNHTFKERAVPNDPDFVNEWDMNNTGTGGGIAGADIQAEAAWDITTGGLTAQGDTIVVAVIDGGFDLTQPDLNFWKNRHEIAGDSIDNDGNGYIDDVKGWNVATSSDVITSAQHGTHVCGTVGARGNNGIGVSGVNWNVRIMPVMYGSAGEADVVVAYSYVRDNRKLYNQTNGAKGAFVVATNSSFGVDLGQPSAYPLWCAMYDSLGAVGILSACATANQNYNIDTQGDIPTACASDWMIAVTNTTKTDAKNSSCGYGATTIDLGSPGTAIWSTLPGSTYGGSSWTGTSMATPHVAGTVAMMYSVQCNQFITDYKANPAAMALVVKDSLLGAVDLIASMGSGITVTGGRLNLFKSVKAVQNYCTTVTQSVGDLDNGNEEFGIKNIYPNPANGMATVVYSSYEQADIVITDVLGRQIKRVKGDVSTRGVQHGYIDLSGIAKGMYMVRICSGEKISKVSKLVID